MLPPGTGIEAGLCRGHNNLGIAFKEQGKLDEAVACYCRALELRPDYAEAHNNLGVAFKDLGEAGRSGCLLPPGTGTEAGLCPGPQQPGRCLKEQGKLDESLACCRRALELKPDYAEAHGNLGSALEVMGDFQGAEDSFRAALRHNPRFAFAHHKLAELLGGKLPEKDLAAQRRLLEQDSASGEQGG